MACAKSYHGPWTVLGNPHPGDLIGTSFRSQISSVFKHPHKQDLYIALADRWLPQSQFGGPEAMALLAQIFGGDPVADTEDVRRMSGYPDTSIADYVWLPVRFDGEMAYLDWKDEWRVEDYE